MMWFLILLLMLVIAVVYAATNASGGSISSARRSLDERLATGQLTTEEHATRVAVLAERTDPRLQRPAIVIGLAVLVLLATLFFWGARGMMGDHMGRGTRSGTARTPVPGAPTVEITATEMRFDPATISSTVGEPVNITLINDGAVFHDLVIDELGFRLTAEPDSRVTGSLTVDGPGTYGLLCTVRGHAAAGMRGALEVSTAG